MTRLLWVAGIFIAGETNPAETAYNLGRTATDDEVRAWDIAISPDGRELPPGSGTAREGAEVYARHCAICHGPTGAEVMYPGGYPPPLVRPQEGPVTGHHLKSATHYWPYATTLWDYIRRAMPMTSRFPGDMSSVPRTLDKPDLAADEIYAVTAYLLHQGGIIGEEEAMDAESLPQVRMPNRDGFVPPDPQNWRPGMHTDPHISPQSGRYIIEE